MINTVNLIKKYYLYILLFALHLPAVWYSLNTPFALVDDLSIWDTLVTNPNDFQQWVQYNLFHFGSGRFMPTYDVYNYLTWFIFRDSSILHHLARLILKLGIAIFSAKALMFFVKKSWDNIPVLVFLSIYLFFPNNPESRIAPTDLLIVFFLSVCIYFLAKLLKNHNGQLDRLTGTEILSFSLAFILMLWSKETAFSVGFVIVAFLLVYNHKFRSLPYILPFCISWIFTFAKVYMAASGPGYGKAPITVDLIASNFGWLTRSLFLMDTSTYLLPLMLTPFLLGIFMMSKAVLSKRSTSDNRPDSSAAPMLGTFQLLLLGLFLAYGAIALVLWSHVLRYYYTLVYLLALFVGCSLIWIDIKGINKFRVYRIFVYSSCFFFIGVNYYNFNYQYATQYYTRLNEGKMLNAVGNLLQNNKYVDAEYDQGFAGNLIRYYFNNFLPYFRGTKYRMPEQTDIFRYDPDDVYLVTRFPESRERFKMHTQLNPISVDKFLTSANRISGFLQNRTESFFWGDAGAGSLGMHWFIFKKGDPDTLYENLSEITISNEDVPIEMNAALDADRFYTISIDYSTSGAAVPFLILIKNDGSFPPHFKLSPVEKQATWREAFYNKKDGVMPVIILRNGSKEGKFVVTRMSLM
jgi:hypothetical protein